jgi:hypothetical protein
VLGTFPVVLCLRAGSLEMLLHHTLWLENFHGLLSMSSRMVCPCLCISASFSQLASSTRWFFHLTRYSKYCFRLVFLLTLLSSMCSICGFLPMAFAFSTGSLAAHLLSLLPQLYMGTKSEMLNIGEISIPSGNSIS